MQPLRKSELKTQRLPKAQLAGTLALFATALRRETAESLMDGLAPEGCELARRELEKLERLSSTERQARVAGQFGTRADAGRRLRQLMALAGPELQNELYALLPPYHRSLFPTFQPLSGQSSRAPVRAFAERLIREAIA